MYLLNNVAYLGKHFILVLTPHLARRAYRLNNVLFNSLRRFLLFFSCFASFF